MLSSIASEKYFAVVYNALLFGNLIRLIQIQLAKPRTLRLDE
jgi:hypothetical protein